MKEFANTPTQMVCGWQSYGDLERLASLSGTAVVIDLLRGACVVNGRKMTPPLFIADIIGRWVRNLYGRDDISAGFVRSAALEVRPLAAGRRLVISCSTSVEAANGSFRSEDCATW